MPTRPDPVALLTMLGACLPEELRRRRADRLARSALHFYRGALPMVIHHLAGTPTSGLTVQLNGDANLANFGLYSTADGLVFDLTDFHETHPGPWEWDLFRLVVDLVVAGRTHGFSGPQRQQAATRAVRRYRRAMIGFAGLSDGELRTARPEDDELRRLRELGHAAHLAEARSGRFLLDERPVRPRTRMVAGRLTMTFGPSHGVPPQRVRGHRETGMREFLEGYASTLDPEARALIEGCELTDVTAVPSPDERTGEVTWFLLLVRRGTGEPLVLRATEVRTCSLGRVVGLPWSPAGQGERVVLGQRLTQVAPDPVAGWQRVDDGQAPPREYHVRQLRDRVVSAEVVRLASFTMSVYGELCAWTLAHGHARTGDRAALAAHLSVDQGLEQRLADSAEAYADQNERDHRRFAEAVAASSGTVAGSR